MRFTPHTLLFQILVYGQNRLHVNALHLEITL